MRFSHHYSSISLIQASQASFFCVPYRIPLTFHTNANFFCKQSRPPQIYFLTPLSIVHACQLTLSTQFDHTITNLNSMKEKKPIKNGDKKGSRKLLCEILCDSDRIQTCNLLIRSQMLYSVELRSHFPQNSSSISVE